MPAERYTPPYRSASNRGSRIIRGSLFALSLYGIFLYMTYVALLRGINVGGKGLIKMSDLKKIFEDLGFLHVRTYINSGNVIFESDMSDQREIEVVIENALAKRYPHGTKVVVRNKNEIAAVIRNLPKNWSSDRDVRHNVIFLRHSIDSKKIVADLNPKPDIEEVSYKPGVLYWSAAVATLTRTSMLKLASKEIYKEMTIRNLNTTKKIFELMNT